MQILQVLPSVLRRVNGELQVDVDFARSVHVYMANFASMTVACPVAKTVVGSGLERCIPARDFPWREDKLKFIALPDGHRLSDHFLCREQVRQILEAEIAEAEYLLFSPYTLIGDWPTVGVREAIRQNKPYMIEADVVYESGSQLITNPWKRAIVKNVIVPMFRRSHRYSLKHSSFALFQGQDTFQAYAPFCKTARKCFNFPIYQGDHIRDEELRAKFERLDSGAPLRICYAGRAVPMKGPMDWLYVIDELVKRGLEVEATWMGDGSMLAEMATFVVDHGLQSCVKLTGYISDHKATLRSIKEADLFLFCHKTLESPRVIGEALACGCPLIGYGGAYCEDLVETHGGGRFAALNDWRGLAQIVQNLDASRAELKTLALQASKSGRLLDRDTELQRRVDLIKQYARNRLP